MVSSQFLRRALAGAALVCASVVLYWVWPAPVPAAMKAAKDRKVAPAFTLQDATNADVKLSDYNGKVVLLNFWATWCGPCKMEIPARIQKNINLLSLEGKPAPVLAGVSLSKGKPLLLFFWAHWCGDCKAEAPILARLKAKFGPKGLILIAPTQKYGYVEGGQEAPPDVELRYIEQVRQKYYASLVDAPVPVSEANFLRYGVSTTPTLVLVDRIGIVRQYRPGRMTYEELHAKIEAILKSPRPLAR